MPTKGTDSSWGGGVSPDHLLTLCLDPALPSICTTATVCCSWLGLQPARKCAKEKLKRCINDLVSVPLQGFFRSSKVQSSLVFPVPPHCCLLLKVSTAFETWIKAQLLKNRFLPRNSCKTNPLAAKPRINTLTYFFALTEISSPQLKKCIFYRVPGANQGQHLLYACFVHMTIFLGLPLICESLGDYKHRHPKQHDRFQSCNGINTCISTGSLEKRPNSSFILLVLFSRPNRSAFSVIPDTHIIPTHSTTVTWLKMLSQLLSPIGKRSGGSQKMVSFFEKILLQNLTVRFIYVFGIHHVAFMKRWNKTASILWFSNTKWFKSICV